MRLIAKAAGLTLLAIATLSAAGGNRLADAVQAGNRDAVRSLVKGGVNVNAAEPDGTTALHWAARADDSDLVTLLLRAGARPGVANRYGVSPLSLAAFNGNATMVDALLKAGADVNATVSKGQTILMTAARTGNAATVKLLLDRGAKVDASEEALGETALMWASAENHPEVVKLLIARGAQIGLHSKTLSFPKDRFGLEGVLTILPRGNWTAMMYASRDGATEAARALIDAGAAINEQDLEGTTALVRAINNGHYDTAGMLLEKGADPNIVDTAGMGALYGVVDMSSLGEVYGRPPRKPTDTLTPVTLAEQLIARGAKVNAVLRTATLQRNHTPGEPALGEGTTALMRASKHGDHAMVKVLLAHGANPALLQKNKTTALMMASGVGRGLGVFSKDIGTEADLHDAAKLLVEAGADVNAVNDSGLTALHYAAQAGLDSVVSVLAEHGAILDAKDSKGRTPVDVAMGVGGRGRAGGPPPVYDHTAALLRKLMAAK